MRPPGRFILDSSSSGVVVHCRDCPSWYATADDRLGGWQRAAEHESAVHPGSHGAADAASKIRVRVAVRSARMAP